jgi:hypothetical protein
MINLKKFSVALLLLPFYEIAVGQTKSINVVTTAVPFLRVAPDAGSGGMGTTGIATTPDINAVYYNIAKIPFLAGKAQVSANYSPWLKEWGKDMYLASVAAYYKLSEEEAIHCHLRYFNPGDLQFVDDKGNYLQTYKPNEFAIDLGYSRKLSEKIGVGLGVKYIRSDLAKGTQNGQSLKPANAIAADLGFYYNLKNTNNEGWAVGASITNLGSRISYSNDESFKSFIPANLGIGVSYNKVINEQNVLNIGLDINKLLVPTQPLEGDSVALVSYKNKSTVNSWISSFSDAPGGFREELREFQISAGAEYWYNNQFAIRAGYFYENKYKGDRKYFSAGAGVKYNVITVNFSYLASTSKGTIKSPLSNTLQFGAIIEIKK